MRPSLKLALPGLIAIFAALPLVEGSFTTFALVLRPYGRACFSELFPPKESIAIHFAVEENPDQSVPHDPAASPEQFGERSPVSHEFSDSAGEVLGRHEHPTDNIFTHTTVHADQITVCADNVSGYSLMVSYNITVNVANNDHERVPDKDHLRQFEEDLERLEETTEAMAAENSLVLDKTRARYFSSDRVPYAATRLAAIALVLILVVRFLQVVYLKYRLRLKKLI